MKLIYNNEFFGIVNNEQIGDILQMEPVNGLPLQDAKSFISITWSNPE